VLVTIVDETTSAPAVDSVKIGELAGAAATDVAARDVVFAIDKLSVRYGGSLALRDATLDQLATLPPDLRKRARHVVCENERTLAAATELEAGNLEAVGALMNDSHRSMRDDFEIVPPQLDDLAAAASNVDGCFGSRMTGGGFGGCTVNLVADGAVDEVRAAAEALGAVVYLCHAAGGVDTP